MRSILGRGAYTAITMLWLATASTNANAQVNIGGTIADGSGGPLLSGTVYVVTSALNVATGTTLTVQAGAIVKFQSATRLTVDGTLLVNGTQPTPAVFTAYTDDSVGGDTNGDGPSSGVAGYWDALIFNATSSASVVRLAEVRYASRFGAFSNASIEINTSGVTLDRCTIRDGREEGIDFNRLPSTATVTGCTIRDHGKIAIRDVQVATVPGLVNNVGSGNGSNYARVWGGSLSADSTITAANCFGGALVLANNGITVPTARTLTLGAGVVIKFFQGVGVVPIVVDGTLMCNGTSTAPVVFTSIKDDTAAGDTNGDGPSTGARGDWAQIQFNTTADASVLTWTEVRYGGALTAASNASVEIHGADVTMTNCTIRDGNEHGIDFNATPSATTVTNCAIDGHRKVAVQAGSLEAIPNFVNNTASGNGQNYFAIGWGQTTTNVAIGAHNMLGGAFVVTASVSVQNGPKIVVGPGVVFKMMPNTFFRCINGTMPQISNGDLLGTAAEPIVFTSFTDDSIGGDTNGDGPSSGAPGQWLGVGWDDGGAGRPSRAEHVLIRYCGAAGQQGGTGIDMRGFAGESIRVEHSAGHGFGALVAQSGRNLVAYRCAASGFIAGGKLEHCTAAYCATGFEVLAGAMAPCTPVGQPSVFNCIAAFCNTPAYKRMHDWQVKNSFGVPTGNQPFGGCWPNGASNGNVVGTDPMMVDAANGDLRLKAGSPCLNAGDMPTAIAVGKDAFENSRVLDHDLTGTYLPDMGAYERSVWVMPVAGKPTLGATLTAAVLGPAGTSIYAIGLLDLPGGVSIAPYGILTVGNPATFLFVSGPRAVGTPFNVVLPGAATLVGARFGLQTLTLSGANPSRGNVTNLYRATLRP